jgi:membrane protein
LWVVAVLGFKLYLAIANPGSAYGALGGVIVLLFFLYVSALIFVLGAEFNAVLAHRHAPNTATDRTATSPVESKPRSGARRLPVRQLR